MGKLWLALGMLGFLIVTLLAAVSAYSEEAPAKYEPVWDSLWQYSAPDWHQDAKFGILIHWGVYSVPALGSEWCLPPCQNPRPPVQVWLQGFHSPVQGGET